MNKFDKLPAIYHIGFYHPKFNYYEDCYPDNCYFNEFSQLILDLKSRKCEAIVYFESILKNLLEDEETTITTVPSHVAFESNSGVRDLASCLVRSKKKYIDGVKCIERVLTVEKYSSAKGCRSEEDHFNSIIVKDGTLIENKNVILMDDILTSGNSANACKRRLLNAGAKEVRIVCLGRTIRGEAIDFTHHCIDENLHNFLNYIDARHHHDVIKIEEEYDLEFKIQSQELHEADEEEFCELEYKLEKSKKNELHEIDYCRSYEEDGYYEYANEAHRALHGEDYLTPNNPFIRFL